MIPESQVYLKLDVEQLKKNITVNLSKFNYKWFCRGKQLMSLHKKLPNDQNQLNKKREKLPSR